MEAAKGGGGEEAPLLAGMWENSHSYRGGAGGMKSLEGEEGVLRGMIRAERAWRAFVLGKVRERAGDDERLFRAICRRLARVDRADLRGEGVDRVLDALADRSARACDRRSTRERRRRRRR